MTSNGAIAGRREWVALPQLGVSAIQAQIDPDAPLSTLHAHALRTEMRDSAEFAVFALRPRLRHATGVVVATAAVSGWSSVETPSGHSRVRPMILTAVELEAERRMVEVALVPHDHRTLCLVLGGRALSSTDDEGSGRNPMQSAVRRR